MGSMSHHLHPSMHRTRQTGCMHACMHVLLQVGETKKYIASPPPPPPKRVLRNGELSFFCPTRLVLSRHLIQWKKKKNNTKPQPKPTDPSVRLPQEKKSHFDKMQTPPPSSEGYHTSTTTTTCTCPVVEETARGEGGTAISLDSSPPPTSPDGY